MQDSLLLNADYSPMRIVSWQRATVLVLSKRANLVEDYAGLKLRSPTSELPWPAVITLRDYVRVGYRIRLSRTNVMARDAFICQYCGAQPVTRTGGPDKSRLTIDHVVPRSQARNGKVTLPWNGRRVWITCWDNVVAACGPCNHHKADRTPREAGMSLRSRPRRPSPSDAVRLHMSRAQVPDEWRAYLNLPDTVSATA